MNQSPVGQDAADSKFLNAKRSVEIAHHRDCGLTRRSNVPDKHSAHSHSHTRPEYSRRPTFLPEDSAPQSGRKQQDDRQFVNSRKNMWGKQANADGAKGTAESNDQVKLREVIYLGFSLNEFAVTKKTDNKQGCAEEWNADLNRVCYGRIINGIARGAQRHCQKSCQKPARIPLAFGKDHCKREQIQRERKDPQERYWCNIFRKMIRNREKHHRAAGGET